MFFIGQKDSKTYGRWTDSEHQKFLKGLQLFGKNWKKIESLIRTRTGAQIRSHAQKFFLKPTKIDRHDNSQVVLENQEGPFMAVISKPDTSVSTEYSYFMQKMYLYGQSRITATTLKKNLNFWDEFMDIKYDNLEVEIQAKRKDSVCLNDICNESKMESTVPDQLLENDGV